MNTTIYRNEYHWLTEPLAEDSSYCERRMFGCLACYYGGLMVVVLADSEPPWNGLLLPTERKHHGAILREFSALAPHPVLGKWLYLRADQSDFEFSAPRIIQAIVAGDPRFGIVPGQRKKKHSAKRRVKKR